MRHFDPVTRVFKIFTIGMLTYVAVLALGQMFPAGHFQGRHVQTARLEMAGRAELDYRPGGWYIGERKVWVDCPQEDACEIQWISGDRVWVYQAGH